MKWIALLLAIGWAATLAIGIPRSHHNYQMAVILNAEKEHWRTLASSREWVCRKRGGEYISHGFYSTFGREPDRENWECKEFEPSN